MAARLLGAAGSSVSLVAAGPGKAAPVLHPLCRQVIEEAHPVLVENIADLSRADLSIRGLVAYLGVPILDADGTVLGALSVHEMTPREWTPDDLEALEELSAMAATEVSLRRKTEEQHCALASIRASEKQFWQLTKNLREVFWMTSSETGEITYVSPTFETVWLRSRESLHADPGTWLESVVPEDRLRVQAVLAHQRFGVRETIEYRIERPDGSVRWIRDRGFPISSETGVVTGVCGIAEDITLEKESTALLHAEVEGRKRAEMQLARVRRLESVGTLASGLAHDLNNMLAPILMSVPLLRTGLPETEKAKLLEMIEGSTHRAAHLIRQVLTFARGMDGEREVVQLKELLHDTQQVLSAIFPRDVRIEFSSGSHLRSVPGDFTQLKRVLMNLCLNARDAMPDGGVLQLMAENCEVDAERAQEMPGLQPGSYVRVRVKDSGRGIAPSVFEHIFDPFFTTKPPGKGEGLGLSSALGIVRSHQGFIDVRSVLGKGTIFEVYLPALTSGAESLKAEVPQAKTGGGKLILVVEDDADVLKSTVSVLDERGYRTLTAVDGTEALSLFAMHRKEIDLVLTDLMMPVVDGVALCRALRKMDPDMPIVAITGVGDEVRMKELKSVSLSGVINKPYATDSLVGTLQNALKADRALSFKAA